MELKCRICFSLCKQKLLNLFNVKIDDKSLADMFMFLSGIEIQMNDPFPMMICIECLSLLTTACDTKRKCIESDKTLRNLIESQTNETETNDRMTEAQSHDFEVVENLNDSFFCCDKCKFQTNRKKNLERHILAVHLKTHKFKCMFSGCSREYTTNAGLKLHLIRDHDESSPFQCEKCQRKFSCASFLKHHSQGLSCRARLRKPNITKDESVKSLYCPHCSFKTAHKFSLKQHINLIHLNIRKPFKCDHCEKIEFTSRISLNNHLFKVHNMHQHVRCEECNQAFWSQAELHIHKVTLKCNARTITEDDFEETALGVRCNLCERSYRSKKEWNTHYFNHHKFKKICDICNLQLKTYGALKNHKKAVHEKLKPHACTECPKEFAAKHSLQFHLNTHSGNKPFKCKWCSFKASDRSSVSKHQKKLHPGQA